MPSPTDSRRTTGLQTAVYDVLRRGMQLYRTVFDAKTLGVRAAVFDTEGRVLLIRQRYARGWYFPGGGIEIGETAVDALSRELFEEARVELTGEPQLHGIFQNTTTTLRDHELLFVIRDFRIV